MPELPDVEHLKRYVDSTALHQRVERVQVIDGRILEGVSEKKLVSRVGGAKFEAASRHGKFLFVALDKGGDLVLHFGMTGELSYYKDGNEDLPEHTRTLFSFENGYCLAYRCQRMLGLVSLTDDREGFIAAHDLGPDAMDESLTAARFAELLAERRGAIKSVLMNQSVIAGVGNVYADEILFQCGLHPKTAVDRLDGKTIRKLYRTMRRVLKVAADRKADPAKLPAGYLLRERQLGGEKCPACGAALKTEKVGGRTSYVCPKCQPLKK